MKKFFIILLIFFIPLQAIAFEDYIITSDIPIVSVSTENKNIAEIKPFFTIDNRKDTMILKAKNVGQTVLKLNTKDREIVVNIEVRDNRTILDEVSGLNYFLLDKAGGD